MFLIPEFEGALTDTLLTGNGQLSVGRKFRCGLGVLIRLEGGVLRGGIGCLLGLHEGAVLLVERGDFQGDFGRGRFRSHFFHKAPGKQDSEKNDQRRMDQKRKEHEEGKALASASSFPFGILPGLG
jgi:hypothetical protein